MAEWGFRPEGCYSSRLIAGSKDLEYARGTKRILQVLCTGCSDTYDLEVEDKAGNKYAVPFREVAFMADGKDIKAANATSCTGRIISVSVLQDGSLSRKKAQEITNEHIRSTWVPGDIKDCQVVGANGFGVFLDVGNGLVALVPENRVSYSHRLLRSLDFKVGLDLKAVFYKASQGRLYMSFREMLGTWEQNAKRFQEETVTSGVVGDIQEFGTFVELAPNLRGLAEPTVPGEYQMGDRVDVYIRCIDFSTKKVKLLVVGHQENGASSSRKPMSMVDFRKYYKYYLDGMGEHIDTWVYCDKSRKGPGERKVMGTDFSNVDREDWR